MVEERKSTVLARGNRIEKILDAYQRFTASKKACLVFSFVFIGIVFFVATTAWVRRDFNDDFSIALALSGNWGEGEGLSLFVNYCLSVVVFALNKAIPAVNWFVALEYATSYLAMVAGSYLCLTRSTLPATALVLTGMTLLIVPECTFFCNFTVIASMNAMAGGLALVMSLREPRHNAGLIVMGAAFLMFAFLFRSEAFLLCIPFFGIAALVVLFAKKFAGNQSPSFGRKVLRLWPFVIVICLGGMLYVADAVGWQEEPWHTWRAFNLSRSLLSDYPQKDYEEIADELAQLGFSENDYNMLDNWMTEDRDFFTPELMTEVAEISSIELLTPERIAESVPAYFTDKLADIRLLPVILMALIVFVFGFGKTERRYALALMAVALAISLYFMVLGRLIARVHQPIWMFAFVAASTFASRDDAPWRSKAGARAWNGALGALRLGTCALCTVVPLLAALAVVGYSGLHFSTDRVAATYAPRSFEPDCTLVDYYRDHPDNVYVSSVYAQKPIRFDYCLRGLPSHDILYSELSLGGWTSYAPFVLAQEEALNIPNVFRGLADNDAMRLVCSKKSEAEMMLTYLREHYYPECTMELVDTVDCREVNMKLFVYDYSK